MAEQREHAVMIRAAAAGDREFIGAALVREFSSTQIWSRRRAFEAMELSALVAWRAEERVGVAVYRDEGGETELLALAAEEKGRGIGTRLLEAVIAGARERGMRRVFLTTTNDNLDALRFYQRRGMRLAALHAGAMEEARRVKPSIPEIGNYGIRMRDDLELEVVIA